MILSSLTMLVIFSIFYVGGVTYLYLSKDRVKNEENKIYKLLLITNIIGLILQLACDFVSYKYDVIPVIISDMILRLYLVYFIVWINLMLIYLIIISFENREKIKKNILIITLIEILFPIFLPYSLFREVANKIYYTTGMAVNFIFISSAIVCVLMVFILIWKRKKITMKKAIPIYVFLAFGNIATIIQRINPELVIITTMESVICCLMYFTIENPDMKIINELYKNKMLVEKSFEEKSNFLFKMTQEVKKPINNMKGIVNRLKSSDDINELKQGVKLLDANSKQMDFIVNDVLDITTLDAKNIKIVNNRYNVYNLFKDIEKRVQEYAKEEVEFRFNIDENIPYLYGDSIKLKQIIMSVLLNSIKKTKSGFIELSIDAIVKYDVCRLIIEVEDSGVGMSIDKVNDVLVTTSELSVDDISNLEKLDINLKLCQKSLKLLGGNLMIRSEEGKGTEVIITIDQQIYANNTNGELEKYEDILYNSSRILIVSDKEEDLTTIKKIINNDNVLINNSFYGKDAIQKIESGKIYDLIIIEDEMSSMSGLTTMQELKRIENFKIPVVVMLGKNKERIKDHYINDGFNDYILRENMNEEVKRILDKYC